MASNGILCLSIKQMMMMMMNDDDDDDDDDDNDDDDDDEKGLMGNFLSLRATYWRQQGNEIGLSV